MTTRHTRRSVLQGTAALAAAGLGNDLPGRPRRAAAASAAEAAVPTGGVNLAGADFGTIPGVHGRDYLYPLRANVDYYRDLGFGLARIPFKWERLQPRLGEPFAADEERRLVEIVTYAAERGLDVILDPHNYAKRRIADDDWTTERSIGSSAVPSAAFSELWSRLAALFAGNDRVLFGLMNEPVGLASEAWLTIVNAAIAAIRRTGARNLVLVPGVAYTGAHSWLSARNTVMAGVIDPADRFAFDVHQYFDADSSGTRPDAVSGTIGSERIAAFQTWARKHGFKAYLGEFNGGRNPASYNALHDLCQEMSSNSDVWLGWAAWAGGPRWPEDEMFNLEPWADGRIREQTAILARHARPRSPAAWVSEGAEIDLDLARSRVFGAESLEAALAVDPHEGNGQRPVEDLLRGDSGLRIGAPAADSLSPSVAFTGPLLRVLQRDAFTLVIETRELPTSPSSVEIVRGGTAPLLRRLPNGAVELALAEPLRTAAQPLARWRAKRRIAIALDRGRGRTAIGATGAAATEGTATVPTIAHVTFPGVGSPGPGGYVIRIVAFPRFLPGSDIDALVA